MQAASSSEGAAESAAPLQVDGLTLRPIRDADLPWLRDLYATTRTGELAAVPWPEAVKRQFLDQQFACQHVHYRDHFVGARFLAIERDGEPIGRYYVHSGHDSDLIVDVCFFPHARGAGLGTALIRTGQRAAAAAGRGMSLHVQHQNGAARRLYDRLGFVVTGSDDTRTAMSWTPPAQ